MHLCDNPTSALQATTALRSASQLFIDCEGYELGAIDGNISLLCVGTPASTEVYLFDCINLPPSSLEPLFALLTSTQVTKFVWDGRHDYSELYHRFNVECKNFVDLQLVDILSRKMRREDEWNRMRRLSLRCHPLHHVKQLDTDGVHALLGLKRAPRDHNIYFADLGEDVPVSHDQWMVRPLRPELLKYAARDVLLISRLHAHFAAEGYLKETTTLARLSQRYITIHKHGRPPKHDVFISSGLCPLEILTDVAGGSQTKECVKCHRKLSEKSFSRRALHPGACKVCDLLAIRAPLLAAQAATPRK